MHYQAQTRGKNITMRFNRPYINWGYFYETPIILTIDGN